LPELPEVETIRRTLEPLIKGKTIEQINILYPGIIKEPDDTKAFEHRLLKQTFQKIDRLGKFLLFYLDDDILISHLRMEGKYGIYGKGDAIEKHTHVIFSLDDGGELRYKDVRKFGTMHIKSFDAAFNTAPLNKLGLEPFSEQFTSHYLYEKLKKTNRKIKAALLDQSIVTGLGNIYVDEVLFYSQVHPERIASSINEKQCEEIHRNIIKVLNDAIEVGGSSIRSYLNSLGDIGLFQLQIAVYGKEGEPCPRCQDEIAKIKVGGRGTHFCPSCQKIDG